MPDGFSYQTNTPQAEAPRVIAPRTGPPPRGDIGSYELIFTAAAAVWRDTGSLRRAAKFLLRAALNANATLRWLRFIATEPVLAGAPFHVHRVLTDKIHRPFARNALSIAGRVECLIAHYVALFTAFPDDVAARLIMGERITLGRLRGDAGVYIVTLSREMLSQHQGELTILLIEPVAKIALARLPLNLVASHNGPCAVMIAGLQGPPSAHKDKIIAATRDLDGLRPKRIVLEAAIGLALWLQAPGVIAIADKNHVSQCMKKWRRKIHADYDLFWQEFGAPQNEAGDFILPVPLPRQDISALPAKKRKPKERRYQRLDELLDSTRRVLTLLG